MNWLPEHDLLLAILQKAREDLDSPSPQLRGEAQYWLYEDTEDFPLIITLLGLDWKIFRLKLKGQALHD